MKHINLRKMLVIRLIAGVMLMGVISTPGYAEEGTATPPVKHHHHHHRGNLAVLKSCVTSLGLPTLPAPSSEKGAFRGEMRAYFAALSSSQKSELQACKKQAFEQKIAAFQSCVTGAGLPALPQASNWQERRTAMKEYVSGLSASQKAQLKTCRQQSFATKS